jgi:two-component system CheB/CheR fusion protein
MPWSAIRAGYATHVLPPERMPGALLSAIHHPSSVREPPAPAETASGFNRVLMAVRAATGHDFAQYKKSTILRRIERRMSQHAIDDMELYARFLKENPAEIHALFKELLINVTSFFRDPEAFALLKQEVLPSLFEGKPEGYVLRVWVAGCATGEEAYSIAMLLREFMDETRKDHKVQLYATDLDDEAIGLARAGVYPPNIAQDVTPERLHRYFVKETPGYRVKKEIREMVVFAIHNVIKDPPFTKLDLLCCRNLMIYLNPELQGRLLPAFHYALKPGGVLFLSPSETIGNHTDLFAPVNRKWKLYRATHSVVPSHAVMGSELTWAGDGRGKTPDTSVKSPKAGNVAELTRRALLQAFVPASVVTDLKGNIVYVHGDTGRYLRPAPGQATLNAVEMAREGLQLELRTALGTATQGTPTLGKEVAVSTDGEVRTVSLSVRPLADSPLGEGLLLVSFEEIAQARPRKSPRRRGATESAERHRVEELERELAYTKENIQATFEEQQASNEELQSTNEELQATNEELETSKEELQSVNEELVTVNSELQAKIEQLTSMQNDMKNLLDNISVGTLFLDQHLVIRRFTREATRVYRLVASDVGRPLGDIKSDLAGEDLVAQAQAVLDSLVPCEREVQTRGGAWYLARIQPYRTLDNVIEGVVLTFTDISKRVEADAAVRAARDLAEGVIDTVREPLVVLDSALRVVSASRAFYRFFQLTREQTVGRRLYELGDRDWDIAPLRELLETVLPRDRAVEDYVVEHHFKGIGHRRVVLNVRRIVGRSADGELILLALERDK